MTFHDAKEIRPFHAIAGAAALLCLGATAPEARIAEVVCDAHDRLETRLKTQYGADMLGRGLRGPDAVLEIWSSARTGDWVLVQTYLDGRSCIVAMGDDWERLPPRPRDPA